MCVGNAQAKRLFRRGCGIRGRLAERDAGVTEIGQPYLVLEYVNGEHIDQYCDRHTLDVQARVRLFLDVLSAVAHAHANLFAPMVDSSPIETRR